MGVRRVRVVAPPPALAPIPAALRSHVATQIGSEVARALAVRGRIDARDRVRVAAEIAAGLQPRRGEGSRAE